jgi:hypothetical protein
VALVALLGTVLALGSVGAVPLQVTHLSETLVGLESPAVFLTHWQQVGSMAGTTPAFRPGLWSTTVTAPTRLPRASVSYLINAGTSGDLALVWIFNETTGIAATSEIEITFHIQYNVGAVATSTTITSYVETQRRALTGGLEFTVYWDSGHTTGITFVNQLEVAQACSAVGTCP